jgi:hypothetical protein
VSDADQTPLERFAASPLFPITGDSLRLKERLPRLDADPIRSGEPGGEPCWSCQRPDDAYLWSDEVWRVGAGRPSGAKQVMLETRTHADLATLSPEQAAGLGPMLQRMERAFLAAGDVGRMHVYRWGDGGSHFHVWLYGRPLGDQNMLGIGLPLWNVAQPAMPSDD